MKNEGKTTTQLEETTRHIPSLTLLALAAGSVLGSACLMASGRPRAALFVGQWAPTILAFAVYNKLVKTFTAPYSEEQRLHHGGNASPWKLKSEGGVAHPSA
jgi:hypothetical protein